MLPIFQNLKCYVIYFRDDSQHRKTVKNVPVYFFFHLHEACKAIFRMLGIWNFDERQLAYVTLHYLWGHPGLKVSQTLKLGRLKLVYLALGNTAFIKS